MNRPHWHMFVTLCAVVTAGLVTAAGSTPGAAAMPGPPVALDGLPQPVTSLLPSVPALPSLPPLPTPTPLPSLTPPTVPQPPAPPTARPPGPTQPVGPPTQPGGAPATSAGPRGGPPVAGTVSPTTPAGLVTPGTAAAIIAADPSADLYPQPPADPATTPQALLVVQLNDIEHRMQYLSNVLARTHADLTIAQQQLGPVATLITMLTGSALAPTAGGAADSPQGRVAALASAVGSAETELAGRQTEAQTIQQTITTRLQQATATVPLPGAPGYGPGRLLRPVPGPITSRFGNRFDPFYHVWQLHAGVDIGAPIGTPIVAAAAGRVSQAGWFGGDGNYTCIDHGQIDGQRLSTCYGHQSRILVTPGQQVNAGQVIGLVGSTGASTGPHLHFEVRLGGRPVDPLPWI